MGFYSPTPCPPLNFSFCPSGFRHWWRTGIRTQTEMQPTQKHAAWVFSKDLSLTYRTKRDNTLICSSFAPRTIWYKTGDGGTWCVVKIAASEIRFWSKTIGKRLPRAKIVLLEEPIYAMGYTRKNRDGLLWGVSRHIPPRVFFLCKFILSFHCENQLTDLAFWIFCEHYFCPCECILPTLFEVWLGWVI